MCASCARDMACVQKGREQLNKTITASYHRIMFYRYVYPKLNECIHTLNCAVENLVHVGLSN